MSPKLLDKYNLVAFSRENRNEYERRPEKMCPVFENKRFAEQCSNNKTII